MARGQGREECEVLRLPGFLAFVPSPTWLLSLVLAHSMFSQN